MGVTIKRLFAKRKIRIKAVVQSIIALADSPLGIYDAEDNLVYGQALERPQTSFSVEIAETQIGWVKGGPEAAVLAEFLSYAAESEFEKRRMGREVLDSYRELNILYNLSDKLALCSDLKQMALLAIEEAGRLLVSAAGTVMLVDRKSNQLESAALVGPAEVFDLCMDIIAFVRDTGKAEIVNDVLADQRFPEIEREASINSLICAPLKAGRETIGVMVLANKAPDTYTAADLKIFAALALQTAPMIEQAQAYEERLRELEQELLELCIEIDEGTRFVSMTDIAQMTYFKELQRKAKRTRERREEN